MESPEPQREEAATGTNEGRPPTQGPPPEDFPSRLQSIVRTLQASPRAFRRAIDARLRAADPSSPLAPGSPSLGRRLISRLLPGAATATTPSSVASSGGEEESYGGPCSSSSSSAPTSSGHRGTSLGHPHNVPGTSRAAGPPGDGSPVVQQSSSSGSPTHVLLPVPEIVLQAPEASAPPLARPTGFSEAALSATSSSSQAKLLTLVVRSGGSGGGSGGSSTVVDGGGGGGGGGGGSEGGAEGQEGAISSSVVPARKSPVTVQEWVDSLPHSGASALGQLEASRQEDALLICRSEDDEVEERTALTGEGVSAVHSDSMVEDGLGLGAEAGHLYTGCVPEEVMCPRQPSSQPSPPTSASQTSRRERSGGGSLSTAKRREAFAGRRRDGEGVTDGAGGGSFQSDGHSPPSHSSIDSLLESRRPDPEEMLFGLGFGGHPGGASLPSQGSGGGGGGPGSVSGSQRGAPSPFPFGSCGNDGGSDDEVSRIPRRFLQPSKVKGVAINDFFKYQQDLIETFESGFCGYRGLTGPSHTVPSVIVAKIMEKLREHERENSSRGSVASFGTGPNCQSPTPPPTPPFSPSSPMVCSPLDDERLHFLQNTVPTSPILSPVESQPTTTTTKFSKVARNVMHRTSILTRMSSLGGDSVASTDDGSGIACSPSSRASLSVLTPDNRKFLDSQGSKSPEMPRRRMIIGQRSFTFDTDGDLIEDLTPPKETVTSPTLPPKPPLVHKDSIISSVTSLTSCDSDSDTDSAPILRRSTSARSSGGRVAPIRVQASGSSDSLTGPWPLGKRMSSTSLSSWEEMGGDGPGAGSHIMPTRGQRPRFLSIDEGDNESVEGQEEAGNNNWIIGSADESGREWVSAECKPGHTIETCSIEVGSLLPASEKPEGSSQVGESSMNEGLWELELDQNDISEESSAPVDVPKMIPPPPGSNLLQGSSGVDNEMENQPKTVISSNSAFTVVAKDSAIVESVDSDRVEEDTLERKSGEEVQMEEVVSVEDRLPSASSLSNFSSCSSAHESSASSHNVRRGSLKRQTKIEVEEEAVVASPSPVDMAVDALNETPRAATPNSQSEDVSTAEPSQQVSEVSSVVAELVFTSHSSSAMKMEEVPRVSKRGEGESHPEERQRRALSPHGRSGSAHSDSSGFLEWEPPGGSKAASAATPLSPPLKPPPPASSSGGNGKGREWMVAEESGQLPSEDGSTSVGSSAYYGVDGISSEMTGQQLQTDAVELALRALRRNLGGEADDGVGREVALGGVNWRETGLANMGGASREGVEEDALQQTHQELAFVREMRCCVSEGLDRVMQFLGTWGKHRLSPRHTQMGELEGDAVKVSSIMSQMTFLLKQQSKLCYEMEQLSMQRLLNGQILGAPGREKLSEVKGGPPMLGIKGEERGGTVVIHGKGIVKGNFRSQSTSPQCSMESGANSRELYLEGVVEQNARELAELKLLLKAVLTPSNSNGHS